MSQVFQNIDPPPPSPPGKCVPPAFVGGGGTHSPGGEGGGGSIFWKTPAIGLLSYSNNLSTALTHFQYSQIRYFNVKLRGNKDIIHHNKCTVFLCVPSVVSENLWLSEVSTTTRHESAPVSRRGNSRRTRQKWARQFTCIPVRIKQAGEVIKLNGFQYVIRSYEEEIYKR